MVQAAPPALPPAPASRKSLIRAGVVLALVLALGGGGWWFIDWQNRSVYGPDQVALSYLTAFQEGDLAKAVGIATPKTTPGASEVLLDPKVASTSPARITDVKVVHTTITGDTATLDTTYSLAGEPHTLTLTAVKDGKQKFVFDKWRLEPPTLATVVLAKPVGLTTTVNGQAFTPDESKTGYALMPGTYEFTAQSTKYLAGDKQSVTVAFADPEAAPRQLGFNITITDALVGEVRAQVAAKLTQCAVDTTAVLSAPANGCPFYILATSSTGPQALNDIAPGTMRWSVETQPQIEVHRAADGAITFTTVTSGKRTYKATSKDGSSEWSGYGPLVISGTVQVSGDQVTLTYS